jgi:hypothetical protein
MVTLSAVSAAAMNNPLARRQGRGRDDDARGDGVRMLDKMRMVRSGMASAPGCGRR